VQVAEHPKVPILTPLSHASPVLSVPSPHTPATNNDLLLFVQTDEPVMMKH